MPNSVNFYLSKGFDRTMAEYFASGRKKAVEVTANDDFTLLIKFDNGELRLFDMKPILDENTVFELLRNLSDFKRVYLDDDNSVCWDKNPDVDSSVVWNNKIDISSDVCYTESIPLKLK